MNTPIGLRSQARTRSAHHHGSHRGLLLDQPRKVRPDLSLLDAIIVPTGRPNAYLETSLRLAQETGAKLLALCSKLASVPKTIDRAQFFNVDIIAVDVSNGVSSGLIPSFSTTTLLDSTPFTRRTDTSLKRNLGLLLAHLAGWERILFLDDDINVPRSDDLLDAAALLDSCDNAGLSIGGFPDNSVVCHAYRQAGGYQETFVGGGALAVRTSNLESFFPKVYNEDWFFLLDHVRLRPLSVTGEAVQRPYDPFQSESRARSEEFGDTLAEGVFWLLDNGRRVQEADHGFWQEFLRNRRRFLGEVIEMLRECDKELADKQRMISCVKAACGRSLLIRPELCVEYMRAWRSDTTRWRRHVELSASMYGRGRYQPEKLLAKLGLASRSAVSYQRTRSAS
jgi:hypothetical protein